MPGKSKKAKHEKKSKVDDSETLEISYTSKY